MSGRHGLPAAVLFDMDGTLIDSEPHWQRAETELMAEHGFTWSHADATLCLGGPLTRVGDIMAARLGPDAAISSQEIQGELMERMEDLLRRNPLVWRPGARSLLAETLALGIPTALVTATYRRLIDAVHVTIAEDLGGEPFTVVVGGDEVTNGKPHPEPYLAAAAALAAEPGRCLVIEDSPTGVASGHAAGCRVIAVEYLAHIEPRERVHIVSTLDGRGLEDLWHAAN